MLRGWPNKWPRPLHARDTQCENIDVENQDTVITVYHIDGVFSLRKYFGLDVCTTDPLLNVVKWIAFFTEIGAIVIFAWPLIALLVVFFTVFGVCITDMGAYRKINSFVERSIEAVLLNFVLVFPYFLSYVCVKPSRQLLLGIQQVGTSQAFLKKSLKTTDQYLTQCKYFPTQLSALKFLPWMLTAFIHSLPLAYFYHCYMTKRTTTLPWPLERILWTDLTYWHWAIGGVVSTLILTPQFLVLAAVIRVRRFDPKLNSVQF
jgi:hypothetical protein